MDFNDCITFFGYSIPIVSLTHGILYNRLHLLWLLWQEQEFFQSLRSRLTPLPILVLDCQKHLIFSWHKELLTRSCHFDDSQLLERWIISHQRSEHCLGHELRAICAFLCFLHVSLLRRCLARHEFFWVWNMSVPNLVLPLIGSRFNLKLCCVMLLIDLGIFGLVIITLVCLESCYWIE